MFHTNVHTLNAAVADVVADAAGAAAAGGDAGAGWAWAIGTVVEGQTEQSDVCCSVLGVAQWVEQEQEDKEQV